MECRVEDLAVTDAAGVCRLREVSAVAATGQLLAVVGPPGPEKAAFLRAISGALPPDWQLSGRIVVGGEDLIRAPAIEWRRRGIGFAPVGGREVEPKRSLKRSLLDAARQSGLRDRDLDRWLGRLFTYFPRLADRQDVTVANLSHGEQALLGLAQVIARRPRLIAIELPSHDVSPFNLGETFAAFRQYAREHQATVICSEENSRALLAEADQVLILRQTRVAFVGSFDDLRADLVARAHLGLSGARPSYGAPRRRP